MSYHAHWAYINHHIPDGGVAFGEGFTICWKDECERPSQDPDFTDPPSEGASETSVIEALICRLKFYQQDPGSKCEENRMAIECLESAAYKLHDRPAGRWKKGK
jgi:hypothetical protein